jgi:hypothetical protein
MKKICLIVLVVVMVITIGSPIPVAKAAVIDIFTIESGINIGVGLKELFKHEYIEKNPPMNVKIIGKFQAQYEQPKVGEPDNEGYREFTFPCDINLTIDVGMDAKFQDKKYTVHLVNGDMILLKKGEAIKIKYTSQIKDVLEKVDTPPTKK